MAISLKSVLMAFVSLLVYYGLYSVVSSNIQTFSLVSSNAFDIFLVAILPFILFAAIILGGLSSSESEYRRY